MAGPSDVTRHWGQVAGNRRIVFFLLVQLLHLLQLLTVVLEDDVQLRIQVTLQALALEDGLELLQQTQGVLDGCDVLEILVDKTLQTSLQLSDLYWMEKILK